jgi:hypothetical protein
MRHNALASTESAATAAAPATELSFSDHAFLESMQIQAAGASWSQGGAALTQEEEEAGDGPVRMLLFGLPLLIAMNVAVWAWALR